MDPRVSRCPLQTRLDTCQLQQSSSSTMTTNSSPAHSPTESLLSHALVAADCPRGKPRGKEAGPRGQALGLTTEKGGRAGGNGADSVAVSV